MYKIYKKEISEISQKIGGGDAEKVVDFLKEKKDYVSEIEIAKKLKLDINTTRRIIYKLQNENLLWSIKQKEKDKNWYVYHWKLNTDQLRKILKKYAEEELEKKEKRYEEEKDKEYFMCPNKCIKLTFEDAINNDFRCPECGELLTKYNNKENLKKLKDKIKKIKIKIKQRNGKNTTRNKKNKIKNHLNKAKQKGRTKRIKKIDEKQRVGRTKTKIKQRKKNKEKKKVKNKKVNKLKKVLRKITKEKVKRKKNGKRKTTKGIKTKI